LYGNLPPIIDSQAAHGPVQALARNPEARGGLAARGRLGQRGLDGLSLRHLGGLGECGLRFTRHTCTVVHMPESVTSAPCTVAVRVCCRCQRFLGTVDWPPGPRAVEITDALCEPCERAELASTEQRLRPLGLLLLLGLGLVGLWQVVIR
jgi:hypothetical protein